MKAFTAFLTLFLTFVRGDWTDIHPDAFIDSINRMQDLWVAGENFPPDTPPEYFASLMGAIRGDVRSEPFEHAQDLIASLPASFDPRQKWPNCPSFDEIRDQSACGSCWAFGSASAMTDRVCTFSNGTKQATISAEDILACSGAGSCAGGDPDAAWRAWTTIGYVTGGNYNSNEGCLPYSLPPKPPKHGKMYPTPPCLKRCRQGYNVSYQQDKHFGLNSHYFSGEENIMAEVYQNGPVSAVMDVYRDFMNYKTGVYRHTMGPLVAGHVIKILGWGVENGTKFWFAANSWGAQWGDRGFFKIIRGVNNCQIEGEGIAGTPKL